jgi:hypothetical protein
MANTNGTAPVNQELLAHVEQAQNDMCDMNFLIKSAMRSIDDDDPQTGFALLRSIDMFSDRIFDLLNHVHDQLNPEKNAKGGAA